MARCHGRAVRDQRLRCSVPHGHWKTTTFVGALRLTSMTTHGLDGPMNGAWFLTYVQQVLAPTLKLGDVGSWTISPNTRAPRFRTPSRPSARLMSLPPHIPDINPIENAFAKRARPCSERRRPGRST